jgi:hypothetical protein
MSDKYFAWHYMTCEMVSTNGRRFFGFFCDFDMTSDRWITEVVKPAIKSMGIENFEVPEDHTVHMLQSIIIDVDTNEKYTAMEANIIPVSEMFDYKQNATIYKSDQSYMSLGLKGSKVSVESDTQHCTMKLNGKSIQKPMWAEDTALVSTG